MRRREPHGSLPPCGGGTGRGVTAIAELRPPARSRVNVFNTRTPLTKKVSADSLLVATPLPVPPPQGGRERCGTGVRNVTALPFSSGAHHDLASAQRAWR